MTQKYLDPPPITQARGKSFFLVGFSIFSIFCTIFLQFVLKHFYFFDFFAVFFVIFYRFIRFFRFFLIFFNFFSIFQPWFTRFFRVIDPSVKGKQNLSKGGFEVTSQIYFVSKYCPCISPSAHTAHIAFPHLFIPLVRSPIMPSLPPLPSS